MQLKMCATGAIKNRKFIHKATPETENHITCGYSSGLVWIPTHWEKKYIDSESVFLISWDAIKQNSKTQI